MNREQTMSRIAIMIPSLSGGGAERVASEISCFLYDAGYEVYIFTEEKNTQYFFKGKIVLLKPTKRIAPFNQDISDLLSLTKEIKHKKRKYNIDTAISFMEQYNLANILSKGREKVLVRVCTILSERDDLKGIYYNKTLLRVLYNLADNVIVLSQYGKSDMIKNYGIKNRKLKIIPNAVVARKIEKNVPWIYGEKVVLSVNRIHPIKQQRALIDAMEEVIAGIPDAKLLLVGNNSGRYAKSLMDLVKRKGLSDNIIFTGHVKNVEYYMQNSQAIALTSLVEGFPNVLVEAMNQGMPIISTNFAGPCREILGVDERLGYGKYGIVVPQINECKRDMEYNARVKKLSEVLITVLTDSQIREQYKNASYKRAKYYSKDKIEALWKEIV